MGYALHHVGDEGVSIVAHEEVAMVLRVEAEVTSEVSTAREGQLQSWQLNQIYRDTAEASLEGTSL